MAAATAHATGDSTGTAGTGWLSPASPAARDRSTPAITGVAADARCADGTAASAGATVRAGAAVTLTSAAPTPLAEVWTIAGATSRTST
ncbi:MAG: hypothetical protein K8R24_14255, partial [Mycobacterium sp.]|nr:hypothetical protein [Mycobacterium sp.]